MNVTQIGEWTLVLNATNSTLVNKYKDMNILATVYTENFEVMNYKLVSINFIDKYNTTIFSDNKLKDTIEVLYNCGL